MRANLRVGSKARPPPKGSKLEDADARLDRGQRIGREEDRLPEDNVIRWYFPSPRPEKRVRS